MGQYYYPTILRQKGKRYYSEEFYAHAYDHNGLKLTEHSWVGNVLVETVMAQLFNKPGRLAWIGDYSAQEDFTELNPSLPAILGQRFIEHYKCFCLEGQESYCKGKHIRHYNSPEACTKRKGRFILNHDKQVYIDMVKYKELAPKDDWCGCLHPIPLLTAIGNGRGDGDYHGPYQEDLGCWAGDLLETQDAKPNGYQDVTEDIAHFKDC